MRIRHSRMLAPIIRHGHERMTPLVHTAWHHVKHCTCYTICCGSVLLVHLVPPMHLMIQSSPARRKALCIYIHRQLTSLGFGSEQERDECCGHILHEEEADMILVRAGLSLLSLLPYSCLVVTAVIRDRVVELEGRMHKRMPASALAVMLPRQEYAGFCNSVCD